MLYHAKRCIASLFGTHVLFSYCACIGRGAFGTCNINFAHAVQAALPHLRKSRGNIVNMSSMMSQTYKTIQMAYNASKAMEDAVHCVCVCIVVCKHCAKCAACHLYPVQRNLCLIACCTMQTPVLMLQMLLPIDAALPQAVPYTSHCALLLVSHMCMQPLHPRLATHSSCSLVVLIWYCPAA